MTPSGWLFLGTLLTAGVTVIGGIVTFLSARATVKAQREADTERLRLAESAQEDQAETNELERLRAVITSLNDHIARVQIWHDECEKRCADCMRAKVEITTNDVRRESRMVELELENTRLSERIQQLEDAGG